MRQALKIFSIIAVVLGGLAMFGAAAQEDMEGAIYSLLGGGLFLAQGILALVYIKQQSKE